MGAPKLVHPDPNAITPGQIASLVTRIIADGSYGRDDRIEPCAVFLGMFSLLGAPIDDFEDTEARLKGAALLDRLAPHAETLVRTVARALRLADERGRFPVDLPRAEALLRGLGFVDAPSAGPCDFHDGPACSGP